MAHHFGGDEARRSRMIGEDLEHALAIFLAAAGGDLYTQYYFFAVIVQALIEIEARFFAVALNCPAGKAARHFRDILLCIAAVDTKRMQLHQLARIVLIEARALGRLARFLLLG